MLVFVKEKQFTKVDSIDFEGHPNEGKEREGGKEGGRERREGREGGREGEREGGRKGGREGQRHKVFKIYSKQFQAHKVHTNHYMYARNNI